MKYFLIILTITVIAVPLESNVLPLFYWSNNVPLCVECGKTLTYQEIVYYLQQVGSKIPEKWYCENCFKNSWLRPLLSLFDNEQHKQKKGDLFIESEIDLLQHHTFWEYGDEEELYCTVDGWHFRVKKGSKALCASHLNEEYEHKDVEIRTMLKQPVVRLYPSETAQNTVMVEYANGQVISLHTKKYLFGIPRDHCSMPVKTREQLVQEALLAYEKDEKEGD